jgi:hypothetical protein
MMTRTMRRSFLAVMLLTGCGAAPAVAPIGAGRRYRPPPGAHGRPCTQRRARTWIHLELFAHGRIVIVPAGIGVAPPRARHGAYVTGGRCRLALYTEEPTGLVGVAARGLTLGDLFAIWGEPLAPDRLAGFRAAVRADVDGRRWGGDPAQIPLLAHAQIVLQAGGPRVRPHATYRFPQDPHRHLSESS